MVKLLPHEHEKLNLMPESMKKSQTRWCVLVWKGRDKKSPGTGWPANLAKWVNSRPGREPVSNNMAANSRRATAEVDP